MSEAQGKETRGKGGGNILVLVGVLATAVIITLVIVIVRLLNTQNEPQEQEKRNVVVTPENVEEVIQEMASKQSESQDTGVPAYYTVNMTNDWVFATGDAVSTNAYVRNAAYNDTDIYFDIVLAEDETHTIYKSPVLPLGTSLDNIKLDEKLSKGVYDCVMIYHLIDDEQNTLTTLRVTLNIAIEE